MDDSELTPYIKDFVGWHKYQQKLETRQNAPYSNKGDIWWASMGVNIGHEEDGKNTYFERPVVIIHKFSDKLDLVMPLTGKPKSGPTIVKFYDEKNEQRFGLLSHIRTIDHRRLQRKIGRVPIETRKRLQMEIMFAIAPNKFRIKQAKRPPVKQVASEMR